MPTQRSVDPYAQPLSRGWIVALTLTAAAVAAAVVFAVNAERWLGEPQALKRALSVFLAPYQELFLASLPGEDATEYVVFLANDAQPAAIEAFFAAQSGAILPRESVLDGLLVVTLTGERTEALRELRAQPFVRMAVRNQGLFFCH